MIWISAGLAYAFLTALANVIDKLVFTRWIAGATVPIFVTACLSILSAALIFVSVEFEPLDATTTSIAIFAGFFAVAAYVPYYWAEQGDTLSRVIPFFYFTPLLVALLAYLFLGEALAIRHYSAAVLLVAGAIAVATEDGYKISIGKPQLFMLLSAFCSAIIIVLAKVALDSAPSVLVFAYIRVGFFIAVIPYFLYRASASTKALRATAWQGLIGITVSEVIVVVSHLIFIYGLRHGSATLIDAIASMNAFFVLVLAYGLRKIIPGVYLDITSRSQGFMKLFGSLLMFVGCIMAAS